jgi:mono/diheme cytochrome c family protein
MIKKIIITLVMVLGVGSLLLTFKLMLTKKISPRQLIELNDSKWQELSSNQEALYRGKIEYQLRCIKCHGNDLKGNYAGPSLIDNEWLHGDNYNDIYKSIYYGNGKMRGYGKKLLLTDIQDITVFIKSKQIQE